MHEESFKHNVEVTVLDGALRVALRFPEVFVNVRKPSHADLLRAVHQQADRLVVAMRTETEVAGVSDGGAPAPIKHRHHRPHTNTHPKRQPQNKPGGMRKKNRRDGLESQSQQWQHMYSHCNACLRRRRRQADVEDRCVHGGAYGQHVGEGTVELPAPVSIEKLLLLETII